MNIQEMAKEINSIIENDSKNATYKFALLKAIISVVKRYNQYLEEDGEDNFIPMGLVIEDWILTYYPIIDYRYFIAQNYHESINGGKQIGFRRAMNSVIELFKPRGGYNEFYDIYMKNKFDERENKVVLKLFKKVYKIIIDQPMKRFGKSKHSSEYPIFQYIKTRNIKEIMKFDRKDLIDEYGKIRISKNLTTTFQLIGSFIVGENAILSQWNRFSNEIIANKNNKNLENVVLSRLEIKPENVRYTAQVRKLIDERTECIWSGKKKIKFDVDHILPFSITKNNDLWNLGPASAKINKIKSDKIPSVERLLEKKNNILKNWKELHKNYSEQFVEEVRFNLIGKSFYEESNMFEVAFDSLIKKANYYIEKCGYTEWN